MYRLRSGRLRERLNVQSHSEVQSSTGVVSRSWATDATRWASVRQLSGRELVAHQQQQGEVVYQIVLRYYSGLTTDQRLTDSAGNVYHIRSIDNFEHRNHVQILTCVEEQ